jgi:hypothetical protein
MKASAPLPLLCLLALAVTALADQLELSNGDRYTGKLLSVDEKQVKFQSEIQGIITLPRDKVNAVYFGSAAPPKAQNLSEQLTKLRNGLDSDAVDQVQRDLLGTATPEAKQQFNDMVQGLLSGKLSLNDVRSQAQSALDQLEEFKQDFDDEDLSGLLNSYSAILQNFLKQTAPASTNRPAPPQQKR